MTYKLPEGWKEVKLGDVVTINPTERLERNQVYRKIGMADIQEYTRKISNYLFDEYKGGTRFRNEDTLFARITPCLENGKIAYVDILEDNEVAFGSTEFIVLRKKENITDSKYIYYLSLSSGVKDNAIKSMVGSSGRQRVQNDVFKNISINLPPLEEQKSIADTLSAIDDKIELNNKINENLEAQAQAIFKHWFVDFEFPDENGNPYKSSSGEMVESEESMIPKGWEVIRLVEKVNIKYGAPFKSREFNEDKVGYPLIRIRDLKTFSPQQYTDEDHPNREFIETGDVLAGMDGEFMPNIWLGKTGVLNQRVCKFESLPGVNYDNYYIYLLIKPHLQYIESYKTGTTVIHLGKRDLESINIINPNENILKRFVKISNILWKKMIKTAKENMALEQLRDTLLPKLMSGEIRIPLD